jgi:hypothetical protein
MEMKRSCQNHEECMKMVQMILDGEATPEQVEHFKNHNLKECMPCIESYKMGFQLKEMLQTKVEKKCCPQQISDTIKLKLGFATSLFLVLQIHLFTFYCSEIKNILTNCH